MSKKNKSHPSPWISWKSIVVAVVCCLAVTRLFLTQQQDQRHSNKKNNLASSADAASAAYCDTQHGTLFLNRCFCHPAHTGLFCTERSWIVNSHWIEATEHCPNLSRNITYDPNDDDGRYRYNCYYSESSGISQVPRAVWKDAQRQELNVWKGGTQTQDRADTHINSFANYEVLKHHVFGKTLEIGCGPWTQLRWIAHALEKQQRATTGTVLSWSLQHITLLEPNGENYMKQVPSCSYKDGKLLGKPITLLPIGGEDLLGHDHEFDTVISINVLDHVQDALRVLQNTYNSLKPGGVLIWHDRWFDSPLGCRSSKDYMGTTLHPIRPKFAVFSHFLTHFEPLYSRITVEHIDSNPAGVKCDGGSIYFIGRKKK